jgi:broad specificity phosphatase PhoE
MALMALDDMIAWFRSGGEVAIYDATNSTQERRALIASRCEREGVRVIFIESICDEATVEANVRATKLDSPDYVGVDPDVAVADFRARIEHYAQVYEPVDENEGSYIKMIDVGRQVIVNRITGYLPARLVSFVLNLHTVPRPIWLTRHGQAEYNVVGRIGGDSHLSDTGRQYAANLKRFYDQRIAPSGEVEVWTSTLVRTHETAEILGRQTLQWRALSEIEAGMCDGLTYAEIRVRYPDEWRARSRDKLSYRYPQGESYMDVIQRVEPVVLELERQRRPVLVISHQAVLRAIYGYLMGREVEEIPHLSIPLHTVLELTPKAYGCEERRFPLGPLLSAQAGPSS